MELAPEMLNWNKKVLEQIRRDNAGALFINVPEEIAILYESLRKHLFTLGRNIKTLPKKTYIAFKAKTNFVDVEIQRSALKCHINLKKGELNDPQGLARDVSRVGHFGNGDYEMVISSKEDIFPFLSLAQQAYEKNS